MGYFRIWTYGHRLLTLCLHIVISKPLEKVKRFLFYRWWNWKSKNQIVPFRPRTMEFKIHSPNSWGFLFNSRCTTMKLILRPTSLTFRDFKANASSEMINLRKEWMGGYFYLWCHGTRMGGHGSIQQHV